MTERQEPIEVLVAARVTEEQLDRMRSLHPRLVIHGEPGGIAIMTGEEAAAHKINTTGLDYPAFRPDLDYQGLLARAEVLFATRIPPDVVRRAPRLRWIQFTSAGVDHLWQPSLGEANVAVTTTRGIHAFPMAEFVMSCVLVFEKGVPRMLRSQWERRWDRFLVEELLDKTMTLLGVGEIGRAVARLAKAFGIHTIGVGRQDTRDQSVPELDQRLPSTALPGVLGRSDYVVASLPLTARTRGVLNEQMFRAMKPSTIFVNVGRGRTVDEAALIRALQEGWIRAAALDVFEQEPLPAASPLWNLPNVLVSPHMGSDTIRYMERMTEVLYDNLVRYAEERPLRNVVDPREGY
jgi:phosphoglycerate dehydrogenase-like enzyme